MTKDEALDLALAALEKYCTPYQDGTHPADEAITAIKQALAAPVQEPVAWVNAVMEQAQVFASAWSLVGGRFDDGSAIDLAEEAKQELRAMLTTPPAAPVQELVCVCGAVWEGQELVETPAAQRQWQGLTDEERTEIRREHYARTIPLMDAIEAKLKEKNT